eukprot:1157911-Pelagomonas_calceolata.AAC.8
MLSSNLPFQADHTNPTKIPAQELYSLQEKAGQHTFMAEGLIPIEMNREPFLNTRSLLGASGGECTGRVAGMARASDSELLSTASLQGMGESNPEANDESRLWVDFWDFVRLLLASNAKRLA